MKVIFCLHHFLPEFIGGTEIYCLRLAQHLKGNGSAIIILIPNFDKSVSERFEFDGIEVIKYCENSIEDREMIMGKKEPDGLKEFTSILLRERPDIVHFHELAPGRGVNIFHVQKVHDLAIPVVLTFHLSYYTCLKGSLIYKEERKCDGIIRIKDCTECVYHSKNISGFKSRILRDTALSLFKIKLNATNLNSSIGTALGFPFVIDKLRNDLKIFTRLAERIVVLADWYKKVLERNGVPSTKLVYIKQALTGNIIRKPSAPAISLPLKVVFVGRISALKGLHLLIDAVCALPEEKISLYIYGSEADVSYTAECKNKSLLKPNINWKGTIPSEDVLSTISNYHLLCLPSVFEMSPLVIQEAFAAGLPVLASDVYGNAEQIADGINGWLFGFKNAADLTSKLLYLTEDPDAVTRVRQHLPPVNSFSNVANRHYELYSEIIQFKNKNS